MSLSAVKSNFRTDINGLRAIAVCSVILFHFNILGFKGGFIGVDVFFVISGFLMTGIIMHGIEANNFSVLKFLLARAARIIPALFILCVVLLLYGVVELIPPDLEKLGRHAASSILFLSNLVYIKEFGYFDNNDDKWLLHTWSLSAEWQFYVILPFALIILTKITKSKKLFELAILIAFLLSIIASILLTPSKPTASFFHLATRAWELLAGALVLIYTKRQPLGSFGRQKSYIGVALIGISIVSFSSATVWPSYSALLPVIGTSLVILANYDKSALLNSRVFQFLGKVSYSTYLWHWPIFVFLHQRGLSDSPVWIVLGIAASIAIGWVSYELVERRAGQVVPVPAIRKAFFFGIVCLALFSAGTFIAANHGLPQRSAVTGYRAAAEKIRYPSLSNGWCQADQNTLDDGQVTGLTYTPSLSNCYVGDKTSPREALLWGDSHAAHFSPFVSRIAISEGYRVHELTAPGCAPLFINDSLGANPEVCAHFRNEALTSKKYRAILISARWDSYVKRPNFANELRESIRQSLKTGAQVTIIAQAPYFRENVGNLYVDSITFKRIFPSNFKEDVSSRSANAEVKKITSEFRGANYIDPAAAFCNKGKCTPILNGIVSYYDNGHINVNGSTELGRQFINNQQRLLPALNN